MSSGTATTTYRSNDELRDFFGRVTTGQASFHDREFHRVVDAAMLELRAVAYRAGITVSEAISYASKAWMNSPALFAEAENPWGMTANIVRRKARRQYIADRIGSSEETVKYARRAGHLLDLDTAPTVTALTPEMEAILEAPRIETRNTKCGPAGQVAVDLLTELAGWDTTDAENAVAEILDAAAMYAENGYQQGADDVTIDIRFARLLDRIKRDDDLHTRICITKTELLALGALLLVSQRGVPGVLWLTGIGEPVDPQAKNIRMALKRLNRATA